MSYLYSPYETTIWSALMERFDNNPYAVAGMMGWMVGESNLYPYAVETDSTPFNNGKTITQRFNELGVNLRGEFSGWYNGWIPDSTYYYYWSVNRRRYGPGYGLAQWTETAANGRKTHMRNYWVSLLKQGIKYSMGDAYFQCRWIYEEMQQSYKGTYKLLCNAKSVAYAMNIWGANYEGWGSNAPSVTAYRLKMGLALYNKYSSRAPIPIQPSTPIPKDSNRTMPLWMMVGYNR